VSALRVETVEELESLEDFRQRARSFIRGNLRQVTPEEMRWERNGNDDEAELATVTRDRELQRMLFDADLAGICFPRAYGGQGLPHEYQIVFNEEIAGYEYPLRVQIPTLSPCAAVILEFGTEEQKLRHLPAILKGEELWMQFLSEPSGGSDVAGALTTAVRDGDQWVLNGSKVWTSGAWWSDWGLCLARTNWDLPKHRGLTVFMLPIHQPNVEVHRIEMNNGSREFCQEFMTDVHIPDADRIGEVDQGWTVGTRWMYHERTVAGGSPYVTRPSGDRANRGVEGGAKGLIRRMQAAGRLDQSGVRELIGESHALGLVGSALTNHVATRIRSGETTDQAAAITRLYGGTSAVRNSSISFELSGGAAVAWSEDESGEELGRSGVGYLMRQAACIGGGTTEMSRNVISERVLGMPRERTVDRDTPFRDVPRSAPSR
jgi:alkylation response protein AidB-like acyl-CoA dehydrogenase